MLSYTIVYVECMLLQNIHRSPFVCPLNDRQSARRLELTWQMM